MVYLNSLFSISFTLFPLWFYKAQQKRPKLVLAPRGMLGAGALNIKPLKKSIFLAVSKAIGLYKSIHWHATAEEEKQEIIKHFNPSIPVQVIPNIAYSSSLSWESIKPYKLTQNTRRFLFCSRISPKKNLLTLIAWFQKIKMPYTLSVVGPSDDVEYYKKCVALAGSNPNIQFLGEKKPEELSTIYLKHDFFILPTRHENFGHVIIEALLHGCPIIISDQTPWRNLVQENIGWDIPLDQEDTFVKTISEAINMSSEDYHQKSEKAVLYAQKMAQTKQNVELYRQLFEKESI